MPASRWPVVLGAHLLTVKPWSATPISALRSYDRFFPSQDTLPAGGFGNLIASASAGWALARIGNSLFLDGDFEPYPRPMGFSFVA